MVKDLFFFVVFTCDRFDVRRGNILSLEMMVILFSGPLLDEKWSSSLLAPKIVLQC